MLLLDLKKQVLHHGEMVVVMPEVAVPDCGTFMCSSCPKRLKHKQWYSIHVRLLYSSGTEENNNGSTKLISFPDNLNCNDKDQVIQKDAEFVLGSLVRKVGGNIIQHLPAKNQAGKKHHLHTAYGFMDHLNMKLLKRLELINLNR